MERTSTWILAAILVAVLASGCTNGGGGPEQGAVDEPEETREASDEATVEYTDSGFQPDRVVINQGGTVTWTDESSNQMWVGSDRHPRHTEYDGTSITEHCSGGQSQTFDQCSSGSEYSFTFDKTGSYTYHNHEAPGDGGTVVVR